MNRIFGSIHYLREKMLSWAQWAELGFDLLLITFLLRLLKYQLAEEESRVGCERKIKAYLDKKHENFETYPIAGFLVKWIIFTFVPRFLFIFILTAWTIPKTLAIIITTRAAQLDQIMNECVRFVISAIYLIPGDPIKFDSSHGFIKYLLLSWYVSNVGLLDGTLINLLWLESSTYMNKTFFYQLVSLLCLFIFSQTVC